MHTEREVGSGCMLNDWTRLCGVRVLQCLTLRCAVLCCDNAVPCCVAPPRYLNLQPDLVLNVLEAPWPHRLKVSTDGFGSGWSLHSTFIAYSCPSQGCVRFSVLEAEKPHRFKVSTRLGSAVPLCVCVCVCWTPALVW